MVSVGKLGFFDSGIGGLEVLREFRVIFPTVDTVYFGDRKNCPYGGRGHDEILSLTELGVAKLVAEGCNIIILACNTAVSHAIHHLQNTVYPPGSRVKVLGVTLPGAERVVELGVRNVGVLATQATTNLRAYSERVKILDTTIKVQEVSAPGLVDIIEQIYIVDRLSGSITQNNSVWENFEPLLLKLLETTISQFSNNIEALVLGCTHYPLIEKEIQLVWKRVHGSMPVIINPGAIAAEKFTSYLAQHREFQLTSNVSSELRSPVQIFL